MSASGALGERSTWGGSKGRCPMVREICGDMVGHPAGHQSVGTMSNGQGV